ncbi:MAG: phosphate regulon transcriptional regulator PhoB [Gammaproteobacteria bacterium]|nr:phosphate regulon transcriptional regulator PhoB [Gammaproteobacteria bacterium]MDH5800869.1 phosphate regulon transcriptional regulator PhoB [Gammaproteobacteria bacterium]
MSQYILVIEDEIAISDMIGYTVEKAGFQWNAVADAGKAMEVIRQTSPDLILLDWMLPGMSGIDFARRLRKDAIHNQLPIIMLTAKNSEEDTLKGFDVGVDDYVSKPFSPKQLVARINAVLRRSTPKQALGEILEVDDLKLDMAGHRVTICDAAIDMGPTEFKLLRFLMQHPERVHSRGQLLDHVWGSNVYIEDRTVDVHIRRLRKALCIGGYDQKIQTVRGAGYRFSIRE